jgi:DNA-directed RNA polymerase specialized sigma24 family protein
MKFFRRKQNPYLSDPDVQLMLEFQGGSKYAFEILMQNYYSRVLNFIYRFLANRESAETLGVSDTAVKSLLSRAKVNVD